MRELQSKRVSQRPLIRYALLFAVSFGMILTLRLLPHPAPMGSPAAPAQRKAENRRAGVWAEFREATGSPGASDTPAPVQTSAVPDRPPAVPPRVDDQSAIEQNPQVIEARVADQALTRLEDAALREERAADRLAALNSLIAMARSKPEPDERLKESIRMSTSDADEGIAKIAQDAFQELGRKGPGASSR